MKQAPIRRASQKDEAHLAALQKRAYVKYVPLLGTAPQPMAEDARRLLEEYEVWVVDGAEDVLAGALVLRTAADHLLIWSVAVDPTQQGVGLGRRLLDFAEAEARKRGLTEIRLYTNALFTDNRQLYAHLGYVETGIELHEGRELVHMAKTLAAAV
ncbi:MAG TPA: GNAT family N-acetyltransferase [Ferrovibrio sp.]|uniref:GNAT family N-acetyltransferase n=1 Tax=Ferrovibrio sp. TaxID=1917215 RepID=UPI002ED2D05C